MARRLRQQHQRRERELAERHLRVVSAEAQRALEGGSQTSWPHLDLMGVHAMWGEEKEAVDALEEAVDRGFRAYTGFDLYAWPRKLVERLRDNERFRGILEDLRAQSDSMRVEAERRGCVC